MSDISKRGPDCDNCEGERGERGERGHRGHRGRDGHDGRDGDTGFTGPTGSTGPTGPTGSTGLTGATGMTGQAGIAPVIALAHVFANGTLFVQKGFTGIAPHVPGSGVYDLTLANPPANIDDVIVAVTPYGSLVGVTLITAAPDRILVTTFDTTTGLNIDSDFMIVAYDLT